MASLWNDVRYALRMMAKSRSFTAIAILTLALGIGANTAIFTVANALLLRPLPYQDPDRLVRISSERDRAGYLSLPYITALSDHNRSFSGIAAYQGESFNLSGRGEPDQITAERVTGNFFDVLGVRPLAGRTFMPEEDQPGGKQVVLISAELAERLFNGDRNAVGRNLSLDSKDYTVVGVLPAKFSVPLLGRKVDIFAPRLMELSIVTPGRIQIGGMYFEGVGRLKPDVTPEQAQAETEVTYRQYKQDKPGNYDSTVTVSMSVTGLQQNLVANVRPTLLILSAAVGFVLLIACANVASLLLARAIGRKKEFAVRTALGASRGSLIVQLLIESMLLAIVSGAFGIALGRIGTRVLAAYSKSNFPQMADVAMDLRVLAFTLAISLLSGVLFGLTPSLQLTRLDLNTMLREEGRSSTGNRRRNRARSVLVVAQVALATVLLVGSGLLIHSFLQLQTVSPGFEPKGTLTMETYLPAARYPQPARKIAFYTAAIQNMRSVPGVQAVSISTALPASGNHGTPFLFEGQPVVPLGQRPVAFIQSISPEYPKVMGVPVIAGRAFSDHDDAEAQPVALVNQCIVRQFWPNQNPLGKRVIVGNLPKPFEVVGVLGDVKNESLALAARPEVFVPYPQLASPLLYLSVRTALDPHSLASPLRGRIAAADPDQPLTGIQTMEERLELASASPRFTMLLIGVFSTTAFILAVIGIYGVIAHSVAQRTQELGIRIALGAEKHDILRLVLGNGLALALAGIAIGLAGSIALTRLMSAMLYETSATDPAIYGGSAALFLAVALMASYFPARRATRIDPAEALRPGF
jgi:putative ABC transport system permease protein